MFKVIVAERAHTPSCTLTLKEWCEGMSNYCIRWEYGAHLFLHQQVTVIQICLVWHLVYSVIIWRPVCVILSNYMAGQVTEIQVLSEIIAFVGWAHKHLID
jgi:hypothetical protein